ncbi:hypothetical protein SAY86_020999 [Trapa natans]|uniref:U-box domain-containing protein n=1 Tax=Trapa natans TaxID=22666 RepID=A0AAN7MJN3_TRANT|nr:hypothetical protein SAY86_020999 [Trapa natans]
MSSRRSPPMSNEGPALVPHPQSAPSSQQLLFEDDPTTRFSRVGDDQGPKPRALGQPSYVQNRFFAGQDAEFRGSLYPNHLHPCEPKWNGIRDAPSGDDATDRKGEGDNDEDEDEDEDHEDHEDVPTESTRAVVEGGSNAQAVNNTGPTSTEIHPPVQMGNYSNPLSVVGPDGESFYPQYLQGVEASQSRGKNVYVENSCGFSRKKDGSFHSDSGVSLRAILSDPVTGSLMDDAMILPCGHSFGGDGIQHVIRMKACPTCSQSVSEDSILPNLSLRAAVSAFRREEGMRINRSLKRRRERIDQDMNSYADSLMDLSKSRSAQFPFSVTDRVIIKVFFHWTYLTHFLLNQYIAV